jgi:hypothetical protein
MNTWNGSPQRELTTNPLSGKLGADHKHAAESCGRTAVRVILANRRYTGQPVWNKQPKSELLIDVNDVALGHATNQAWNEPGK